MYGTDPKKKLVFEMIKEYFNGNINKTFTWFTTPNSYLGGLSPLNMMKNGRTDKLLKFIKAHKEGYFI
ncbi:MAG TPA: hypothetical protein VNF93_02370 [Buchnera sp. (in: enterobacteria)]|nr:hypothetical protein [Buchnera sp. (in: enterobacteria)]